MDQESSEKVSGTESTFVPVPSTELQASSDVVQSGSNEEPQIDNQEDMKPESLTITRKEEPSNEEQLSFETAPLTSEVPIDLDSTPIPEPEPISVTSSNNEEPTEPYVPNIDAIENIAEDEVNQPAMLEMEADLQEVEADEANQQVLPAQTTDIDPSSLVSQIEGIQENQDNAHNIASDILVTDVVPEVSSVPKISEQQSIDFTSPQNVDEEISDFISSEEDLQALSSFYSISIESLQNDKDLFISLLMKFREFETLKSNNQLLQINFEQSQHTQKRKLEQAKAELTSLHAEYELLKESETKISAEKEELQSTLLKVHGSNDKTQKLISDLKNRLEEVEKSKAFTADLLETKQTQLDNLNLEIKTLVEENRNIRVAMSTIESSKETINTELMKYKLNCNKFENEVQLLNSSKEWYEKELKTKTDEFEEFRTKQGKTLASTSSKLNTMQQEVEILSSSLENYKSQLSKVSSQRDDYQFQVKELTDKLSTQEHQYMVTLNKRDEHIQVLEKSLKDKTQRIDTLDSLYKETSEKVKSDEEGYHQKFDDLESQILTKEAKIRDLEATIESLTEKSMVNDEGLHVSSFIHKTLNDMNSELSLTDLLGELNSLKKEVIMEKRAKVRAETELSNILKELQRKMPLLESYEEKVKSFKTKEQMLNNMIGSLTKEKKNVSKTCDLLNKKFNEAELQNKNLTKYKIDLQKQLIVLLTELQFKQCGESPLTSEEKTYINKIASSFGEIKDYDENDTDNLISTRLTTFKNMNELIKQNENLLVVSRKLASDLESKDSNSGGLLGNAETETIQKAKAAIVKLQEKIGSLETQLEATINSRDMLQSLFDSGVATVGDQSDKDATAARINSLVEELKNKKNEVSEVRKSYDEKLYELNIKVQKAEAEKSASELKLSREVSSNDLNQEKINNLNSTINFIKQEAAQLRSILQKTNDNSATLETKLQSVNEELNKKNVAVVDFEIQVKTLNAEKNVWKSVEDQLRNEINKLYEEKAAYNARYVSLQTLDSERQAHFKETLQRFTNDIDSLQREVGTLRSKLDKSNSEISNILHSKNVDSKVYQKRIDLLVEELNITKSSLSTKIGLIKDLEAELDTLKKKHIALDERKQNAINSISSSSESSNVTVLQEELRNALEDLDVAMRESSQYKELSTVAEKQLSTLNENYIQYKALSDEKITSLTVTVDTLTNKVEELEKEKEAAVYDFTNLQHTSELSKQEYSAKIEELNLTIGTFDALKSDQEAKIELLKKELAEKEERIEQINSLVVDKNNQIDTLENIANSEKKEIGEIKSTLLEAEKNITEKDALLESEKLKFKDLIANAEQDLRNSKIRISELEAQNRTLLNQIEESPLAFGESDDMKNLVTYLNREKDSLSQQLSYVQGEESILRQSITSKEKEIMELKSELAIVREKSSTIDKYAESLANMKGEVEELRVYKENNSGLRDQIKMYESKISELESQVQQVSAKYSSLVSKNEDLQKDVESVSAKNSQLSQQLTDAQARLEQAPVGGVSNEELAAKDAKIQELQAKLTEKEQVVARMRTEFIEKLKRKDSEKSLIIEDLTKKLITLEKQVSEGSANVNGDSDIIETLKSQIKTLEEQIQQKIAENINISKSNADQLGKAESEMEALKKELETLKSTKPLDSQSVQTDVSEIEKKYSEEKNELLKQIEGLKKSATELATNELEKLKDALRAEYKAEADAEVQSQKLKYQARVNGVIEKRVQPFKDQIKKYEATLEELKKNASGGSSSGSDNTVSINGNEALLKKFESEKEDLKKQVRISVEREKEVKEKLLQGKINRLEEEIKKLKQLSSSPAKSADSGKSMMTMPNMPMNMPMGNFGNMSNMPNMPNMSNMTMPNMSNMPNFNFQQMKPTFGNLNGNQPTSSAPSAFGSSIPRNIPNKPAKRTADDDKEAEKRTKTE